MIQYNPFETLVDSYKDRDQQVEDTALAFFALAEKLEAARINDVDPKTYNAILDANMYLWTFSARLIQKNFWRETPEDSRLLLEKIADFMTRSGQVLQEQKDDTLLAKLVAMNVNMCNHILQQKEVEQETGQATLAGLAAAAKPIFA